MKLMFSVLIFGSGVENIRHNIFINNVIVVIIFNDVGSVDII